MKAGFMFLDKINQISYPLIALTKADFPQPVRPTKARRFLGFDWVFPILRLHKSILSFKIFNGAGTTKTWKEYAGLTLLLFSALCCIINNKCYMSDRHVVCGIFLLFLKVHLSRWSILIGSWAVQTALTRSTQRNYEKHFKKCDLGKFFV